MRSRTWSVGNKNNGDWKNARCSSARCATPPEWRDRTLNLEYSPDRVARDIEASFAGKLSKSNPHVEYLGSSRPSLKRYGSAHACCEVRAPHHEDGQYDGYAWPAPIMEQCTQRQTDAHHSSSMAGSETRGAQAGGVIGAAVKSGEGAQQQHNHLPPGGWAQPIGRTTAAATKARAT